MPRPLKVYGWTAHRTGVGQTREIMAGYSVAEVLRTAGITRAEYYFDGCETGNTEEVIRAESLPGVVFFRSINAVKGDTWDILN